MDSCCLAWQGFNAEAWKNDGPHVPAKVHAPGVWFGFVVSAPNGGRLNVQFNAKADLAAFARRLLEVAEG